MEKWKWIEEIIDGEDEKLKSNILDDLKILIFSNWGAQENLLRKLCEKKVNFKWHVNVMRSHVKWYFLSTDTASNKRKEMKENGKTLRWLSINVNFMWIYYVSIYFPAVPRCHFAIFLNRKIKIFNIFFLFIVEITEGETCNRFRGGKMS